LSSGEVLGHSCAPARRGPFAEGAGRRPQPPFKPSLPPGAPGGGGHSPVLGFPPVLLARSRLGPAVAEAGARTPGMSERDERVEGRGPALTPGRLACPTKASTYRRLARAPRPQFKRGPHPGNPAQRGGGGAGTLKGSWRCRWCAGAQLCPGAHSSCDPPRRLGASPDLEVPRRVPRSPGVSGLQAVSVLGSLGLGG
jgi:hypothetical protein